jgi:anti-anti-sigma regulatory factor
MTRAGPIEMTVDLIGGSIRTRPATPVVEVLTLADGLVVRLAGVFRTEQAGLLRDALLRPRPAACRDVIVDAGAVSGIDGESLSVLTAASRWTTRTGGQLSFSRLSPAVTTVADDLGVLDGLQLLGAPGCRAA